MAKKVAKPYFQEFQKVLTKKLKEIKNKIEPEQEGQLFESLTPEATFLKGLAEGVTKYPFRYYQKEAIYTLHSVYGQAINVCNSPEEVQKNLLRQKDYAHIKPLLEKVDKESNKLAPFIGYEMATGSGKTMLMGATVYYLNKYHNIRNFLIITPSSTEIYKKTIRNFQIGSKETVWHDEVPFKFNLITGDNYKDIKDLFNGDTEANIFVFNIDKFGSNATQTKKQWEGSEWKDKQGNTISLLDFLAQNDLSIITDEAHHTQSLKAKKIISAFKPKAIIEFTATAVETEKNKAKKNQSIVYKYDIRKFLDDKYGKKVRVLALPSDDKKVGKTTTITETEKYKLITFFLVHLLKKKALLTDVKCRDLKAIGFVKVKDDIKFSEKIEAYIKEDLAKEVELIALILEKAKQEDTETTNLILQMYEEDYGADITQLQQAIQAAANNAILHHSKVDKLIRKKFDDIQKNEVEIVIFIKTLDEGIDMPNIYSMVIINDNPTEFKTSVKQIVGRGVRLNKLQREHDEEEINDLLTHTEKLHIVCDKGASFEEVVLQIQQEFGLNDKTFAIERGEEKLIDNPVKTQKLKGIQIPKVRIDFKRKEGANIQSVLTNYDKIMEDYLESNSFPRELEEGKTTPFLKYTPDNFFTEVDLFADEKLFHKLGEDQDWNYEQLVLSKKNMKDIYGRVLQKVKPIPDVPKTFKIFQEYGHKLNDIGIYFYSLDEVDEKLATNRFIDSFTYFFIHYVENEYFELDLDTIDAESNSWLLQNQFKTEKIKVRAKDIHNTSRVLTDEKEVIDLIRNGYYFYGYENSVYDYDKFDSYPEKKLADYVNNLILQEPEKEAPFWVRNERNIHFEYGTHKYYPDFIFFYNQIIYVIEVKGEAFSNVKKNRLLLELNNVGGIGKVEGYIGMVVFEAQMKKLDDFEKSFDTFREEAENYFKQLQTKAELVVEEEVPNELKYKEYVPAYEAKQAFSKYIKHKEPRSTKWLKVSPNDYPNTTFATLVKSDDLGEEFKNQWVLMNNQIPKDIKQLIGTTILCHHPIINDNSYAAGLTIRPFDYIEEKKQIGMFDETYHKVVLTSENNDDIMIKDKLEQFQVIGLSMNSI